jgi:5'-3' exonuclease
MLSPKWLIRFVVVWQIDKNGKRNQWEGVVLIPFIDDDKLLTAISANCPRFCPE